MDFIRGGGMHAAVLVLLLAVLPSQPASGSESHGRSTHAREVSTPPRCYTYEPEVCLICAHNESESRNCFRRMQAHSDGRFYAFSRTFAKNNPSPHFQPMPWVNALRNTSFGVLKDLVSLGATGSCPIWESGRFVEAKCDALAMHSMDDPALLVAARQRHAADPTSYCTRHCCSLDQLLDGSFANAHTGAGDDWPLSHFWVPRDGCRPRGFRPMAAVPCFHAHGVRRIVLVGDSMLRQLAGRFASMSRHHRNTVDHPSRGDAKGQAPSAPERFMGDDARYRLWRDHDLYEMGPDRPMEAAGGVNEAQVAEQYEQHVRWELDMLRPHTRHRVLLRPPNKHFDSRLTREPMEAPLLDMVYIWRHVLESQIDFWESVDAIAEEDGPAAMEGSIVLTGVWAWEIELWKRKDIFKKLMGLIAKPRSWVHRVYVLNAPTGKTSTLFKDPVYAEINRRARAALANVSHVTLLDFEAISKAHPFKAPETDAPPNGDAHYGCMMTWPEDLFAINTHAGCTDTANTLVWQALFNHMCSPGFRERS